MPPKSPDDEAIVDEIVSMVVIADWASSSIMSGDAARSGAFAGAAQDKRCRQHGLSSGGGGRGLSSRRVWSQTAVASGRRAAWTPPAQTHAYRAHAKAAPSKGWSQGSGSPLRRLAVCTTKQLATQSEATIRSSVRDISAHRGAD